MKMYVNVADATVVYPVEKPEVEAKDNNRVSEREGARKRNEVKAARQKTRPKRLMRRSRSKSPLH